MRRGWQLFNFEKEHGKSASTHSKLMLAIGYFLLLFLNWNSYMLEYVTNWLEQKIYSDFF